MTQTQLQMERAARAADARTQAIALYNTNALAAGERSPLILAAAFSGLLWTLFLARTLILLT